MPAITLSEDFEYVGVGMASRDEWTGDPAAYDAVHEGEIAKTAAFVEDYGGRVFEGYETLINADDVDAVYLPLPPALHHGWATKVLNAGKHALVEKPFTTSVEDTEDLLALAKDKGLAVHENYMFAFHSQIQFVKDTMESGCLGEMRLIRLSFGFPFRGANDFRYNKALGGGALLDCGGYPVKLATLLLGPTARVTDANLQLGRDLDVDLYGSGTLVNDDGLTVQLAFGMDNAYRCDIDLWGSTGSMSSGRILTAPVGYDPVFTFTTPEGVVDETLPEDDSFLGSINAFAKSIKDPSAAAKAMDAIAHQATLVSVFQAVAPR
jgi:predicted dehydrogenase